MTKVISNIVDPEVESLWKCQTAAVFGNTNNEIWNSNGFLIIIQNSINKKNVEGFLDKHISLLLLAR